MRQFRHFCWTMLGFLVGIVALTAATASAWLLCRAHRVDPDSPLGNCWTYAVPRWLEFGGYLCIRRSDHIKLFKRFLVPHAIWCKEPPRAGSMEQCVPRNPVECDILPYHAVYFDRVIETQDEHATHYAERAA